MNIALAAAVVDTCTACDTDNDGQVGINELIQAVRAALDGCDLTTEAQRLRELRVSVPPW